MAYIYHNASGVARKKSGYPRGHKYKKAFLISLAINVIFLGLLLSNLTT